MLRLMNKYRDDLGVVAEPQELEASALAHRGVPEDPHRTMEVSPVAT